MKQEETGLSQCQIEAQYKIDFTQAIRHIVAKVSNLFDVIGNYSDAGIDMPKYEYNNRFHKIIIEISLFNIKYAQHATDNFFSKELKRELKMIPSYVKDCEAIFVAFELINNAWFNDSENKISQSRINNGVYELRNVLDIVCDFYDLSFREITSDCRERLLSDARKFYCYFARDLKKHSLSSIGKLINRDHSTVIYNANFITYTKDKSLIKIKTQLEKLI